MPKTEWTGFCLTCGVPVVRLNPAKIARGEGRFCSRECFHKVGHYKTHGHKPETSATYRCWRAMKQRCLNPKNRFYRNYGERGISICERWVGSFENFLADMGEKPQGLTLDRIDVNGNYGPENCRWATWEQQCENKRDPYRMVNYRGVDVPVRKLAKEFGLEFHALLSRIRIGWPEERWAEPSRRQKRPSIPAKC